MTTTVVDDPATLRERLCAAAEQWPLAAEADRRIKTLERLCGMMTDTGVILEEDAAELSRPDWWWVPGDGDLSYGELEAAYRDDLLNLEPLQPHEWERSHVLPNAFSVKFPAILSATGRTVEPERIEEFESYAAAEEAIAVHHLRWRRAGETA